MFNFPLIFHMAEISLKIEYLQFYPLKNKDCYEKSDYCIFITLQIEQKWDTLYSTNSTTRILQRVVTPNPSYPPFPPNCCSKYFYKTGILCFLHFSALVITLIIANGGGGGGNYESPLCFWEQARLHLRDKRIIINSVIINTDPPRGKGLERCNKRKTQGVNLKNVVASLFYQSYFKQ